MLKTIYQRGLIVNIKYKEYMHLKNTNEFIDTLLGGTSLFKDSCEECILEYKFYDGTFSTTNIVTGNTWTFNPKHVSLEQIQSMYMDKLLYVRELLLDSPVVCRIQYQNDKSHYQIIVKITDVHNPIGKVSTALITNKKQALRLENVKSIEVVPNEVLESLRV